MFFILALVVLFGGLTVLIIFGGGGQIGVMDAGQFASLISLSAIGIWVGIGAFDRTSISQNLRNAALWAGIFLALGVVYAYRFEFLMVKDQLVMNFIPGAVNSQTNNGQIIVSTTRNSQGQFQLNGFVNGQKIAFLLDTGASNIVLSAQTAKELGFELDKLRYSVTVSTAAGTTSAALVRLKTISIGDIERHNIQALISRPNDLSTDLLGMNFLNTLSAFSFKNDRVILQD